MLRPTVSGIYLIRNTVNGKCYVGRSKNIWKRWQGHKSESKNLRRNSKYGDLYTEINSSGIEKFELYVLLETTENMPYYELLYILENDAFFPNGYNKGGTFGGWPTKEILKVMPKELLNLWKEQYTRIGKLGVATLKELRKDPQQEKKYLESFRMRSIKREANIRAKRLIDPQYDILIAKKRSEATKNRQEGYQYRGIEVLKKRMAEDPEFDKKLRENRARAARIRHQRKKEKNATLS